ncbi:hypothetical protein T310_0323 [Rasamsonia emersonii CBS 393.64]|uniref:Uncharacterized protein n=1 Tax=Rasamsonia emersonii (strain ATCC 16479 / CBS 393.64 / IMI 116815) TaxID=1408163 RepID=A0A0F4Z746_RASE3|nr:hypothetical protein T310_0323 [Rasamsonia emersonii CBS 393.64]KKA25683.1 hypothetical protein T310_0323 [Rasamsonia emersonii CBS 393.64]
MTTTLERSLSRASSVSIPVSSPQLYVHREISPPAESDPALWHIHDRINQLDSRISELRSTVLTKDGYVDRRNREDEYIRREFEAHRAIAGRIDVNVSLLRTDVDQLKLALTQLKSNVGQLGTDAMFIRSDVDRLQKSVQQVQADLEALQSDVCSCHVEISKLHASVSQIRTDLLTLQHDTSRHLNSVSNRFSLMEARMTQMDRVRFNSLAYTIHAPITPVPKIEDDGTLRYPDYFPSTVWRFWCLKKRSRIHRLVELAEFYELGGYQHWGRMHYDGLPPDDSDSSDSSERPSNLTRAEAARQYPEACHQALAATLGLVYYKIRKEVGEGPNSRIQRPPKRLPEEMASTSSNSKQKPAKVARRPGNVSPTMLHKLVTGAPSVASKSVVSEEQDRLGWRVSSSEISDETMSKLKGILSDEVNALLRAVERGKFHFKPSKSEQLNMSPTESKRDALKAESPEEAAPEDEVRTVSTELISPILVKDEVAKDEASAKDEVHLPDTSSSVT